MERCACMTCAHYRGFWTCVAFPGREHTIPVEIIEGENDHRTPIKGDHGITYEEIKIPEKKKG